LKWVTRPVIEDGVQKVEGWWEERVVPGLKLWSTSQESHAIDQNYFEPARMQGAVRNNQSIFRVLSDTSNNDQISHSYTSRVDEKGNRLTKPLLCFVIDPDSEEPTTESEDTSESVPHYRLAPWKLMPFLFENDGSVPGLVALDRQGKGYDRHRSTSGGIRP
jgi:hypothetical protein